MNDQVWMRLMKFGHRLGCHQKPERSFFIKGYQFPVCARCTGVILSFPVALVLAIKKKLSAGVCVLLSSIMFFDWFIQRIKIKKSTNSRRFVTGMIGGLGVNTLYFKGMFSFFRK